MQKEMSDFQIDASILLEDIEQNIEILKDNLLQLQQLSQTYAVPQLNFNGDKMMNLLSPLENAMIDYRMNLEDYYAN